MSTTKGGWIFTNDLRLEYSCAATLPRLAQKKSPRNRSFQGFCMVAGVGFEPTTYWNLPTLIVPNRQKTTILLSTNYV
jgi:hypothetical protein